VIFPIFVIKNLELKLELGHNIAEQMNRSLIKDAAVKFYGRDGGTTFPLREVPG
jgi:hypothetical protein